MIGGISRVSVCCVSVRRLCCFAIALMALLGRTAPALTVSASVGFDGYYTPGRWTPISITVENLASPDGKGRAPTDFDGYVRLASSGVAADRTPMLFSRELQVPVNDRKRLTLYAKFPAAGDSAEIELVLRNGRRMATVRSPRKAVAVDQPLVAVIKTTDAAITLGKISDLAVPQMAVLDPAHLPDRWYGYDGVSMLILPRMLDKLLDRDRAEALRRWISAGGRLVLVGGRNSQSYQGTLVENLLPGRITGTGFYQQSENNLTATEAPAPASNIPLAQITQLEPATTATLLLSGGKVPILYEGRYGGGSVYFLASDWSPRLFQLVPVPKYLLTSLVTSADFSGAVQRLESMFPFGDGAYSGLGSASALPEPKIVTLLLLSYLIAVGPANFYILARRRRLELAWVTVPAIVILFSTVTFFMASWIRGSTSYLRSYHLLTGSAGSPALRCSTLTLTYLPESRRADLRPEQKDSAALGHTVWLEPDRQLMPHFSGAALTAASSDQAIVVAQQPERMVLQGKRMQQWASEYTRFDCVTEVGEGLHAEVVLSGSHAEIGLHNATGSPVSDLNLVIGGRAYPLAESSAKLKTHFPPGESTTVTVSLATTGRAIADISSVDLSRILEQSIFQRLAATLAATQAMKPDLPPCFLLGRIGATPNKIVATSGIGVASDHAYVALTLPVRWARNPEPMRLAAGARLVNDPGSFYSPGGENSVSLGSSPVTFSVPLAAPLPGRRSQLEMSIGWGGASSNQAELPFVCQVFDYSSWVWTAAEITPTGQSTSSAAKPNHNYHGSQTLDNTVQQGTVSLEGIDQPAHPATGAILVKLGARYEKQPPSGLFVVPPTVSGYQP